MIQHMQEKQMTSKFPTRGEFATDEATVAFIANLHKHRIVSDRQRDELLARCAKLSMRVLAAGLVEKAVLWNWGSARWYDDRRSVGVPIDWIECS